MVEPKLKKNSSALKRLRSSLKEAGFMGPGGASKGGQTKKQRQGSNAMQAAKNHRSEKLSLIKDAFNPFEIKTKHRTMASKVKSSVGYPTMSKQIGIENRKKTLLVEYRAKNRTGAIVDRRLGENNDSMTPEERMLERFKKEKQKKIRGKSMFNLEEEDLTHFGQSLGEMDEFDDPVLTDDEEQGAIDKETVAAAHFGGFDPKEKKDEDPNRIKSKAEVMKEVMAKSKFYKIERQKAKEEDEALRMELDDNLADIKSLLMESAAISKRKPLVPQSSLFKREMAENPAEPLQDEKADDYDRHVREMAFEQRAQATDRLKTEEEIALEARSALEKAERHRLRRMKGEDSETEDENLSKEERRSKPSRTAQADDLDGDFVQDTSNYGLGQGVKVRVFNPQDSKFDDEDEDSDSNNEEEDEDDEDEEEEEEEDIDSDNDEGEGECHSDEIDNELDEEDIYSDNEIEQSKPALVSASKPKQLSTPTDSLPFTFTIPKSIEDHYKLVKGCKPIDHDTLIQRARVINHVILAPENKGNLEEFIQILLLYLANNNSLTTELINIYTKHITELAIELPEAAAKAASQFLESLQEEFRLYQSSGLKSFPSPGQLVVLTLFLRLFSTSDYFHTIITPLLLFLGQYLLQAPMSCPGDMLRSLYMCGLCFEAQSEAKRFFPEPISAICTLLFLLTPKSMKPLLTAHPNFFYHQFQLQDQTLITSLESVTESAYATFNSQHSLCLKLKFSDLLLAPNSPYFQTPEFITTVLLVSIRQLSKFADLYSIPSCPVPAFPEVFSPVSEALRALSSSETVSESLRNTVLEYHTELQSHITRCQNGRFSLQLQNHRPLAIKSLLPKFDAEYSADRYERDPNQEKAAFTKLQRQHKRELKGAIRELRKDSQFLAREKLATIKQKDAEYKDKVRKITGEIANTKGDSAKFNYEMLPKLNRRR